MDEVSSGRPQSFRYQRRLVNDCSPRREGMAQDSGTRGGTFTWRNGPLQKSQGWTTGCSSMPERDGKDQREERTAQSKRARAGSFAIVD